MIATLAESIYNERVDFERLHERYNPVLRLVDVLIGVVPNCDPYLEVWPPGFRTYNLMVPNFLNLPAALFGRGAPKDVVGLGMYVSSRAASCAYCSAHTCSFALRRGSTPGAVTGSNRSPGEGAAAAIAESLSTDPHHYVHAHADELRRHYDDDDAEWIVMGVAMMGFLNKFMDAMGVELEPEAVGDVIDLIGPTGWAVGQHAWADGEGEAPRGGQPAKDNLATMLKVLRHGPAAARLDKEWMDGVPSGAEAARAHLRERHGYDEELLSHMRHTKARRALAAMLRHNTDPAQSELGIGLKALAGLVYADHMDNEWLLAKAVSMASANGVSDEVVAAVRAGAIESPALADPRTSAVVTAAQAMSPSPATVEASTIKSVTAALTAAEIVETAVWVSVSQLQHRLSLYYGLTSQED